MRLANQDGNLGRTTLVVKVLVWNSQKLCSVPSFAQKFCLVLMAVRYLNTFEDLSINFSVAVSPLGI